MYIHPPKPVDRQGPTTDKVVSAEDLGTRQMTPSTTVEVYGKVNLLVPSGLALYALRSQAAPAFRNG